MQIRSLCFCGKSDAAAAAQQRTMAAVYSSWEGKALAEFIRRESQKYQLPIAVTTACDPIAWGWMYPKARWRGAIT